MPAAAELARLWIESWNRMDLDWLRRNLAPDFVHVSPFGRLEGRDPYLEVVEPLARKSVSELVILEIVAAGDVAAVRYENRTARGAVEIVDWVRAEGGAIREIRAFYDPAKIRELLSPDEQQSLDGSA